MKKILLTILLTIGFCQKFESCVHYDPDYDYFNLFAQETISNHSYYPFLLTYSNTFYEKNKEIDLKDENIEDWQTYFNNELTYSETDALLKVIDIKHLYNIKKGKLTHQLFKKTGVKFYKKYKEGLDYIIEAKYLQPYMRVKNSGDSYSFYEEDETQNATEINYKKNHKALISLYNAAKNKSIKLRYGYQIIRFNHYTGRYQKAIDSFKKYVQPLKDNSPIYWYALDQMAGAERGLGLNDQANYHFFKVFMNSRNRKESTFVSMKLTNDGDFKNLLSRAKTKEEQNFVHFLLAYNSYNNEIPVIKKIFNNDSQSDLTKVLVARAMNQLERSYLPYEINCYDNDCHYKTERLPVAKNSSMYSETKVNEKYINDLEEFLSKAKKETNDDFWKISLAYVHFLKGKHKQSDLLLSEIKTDNTLYISQIERIRLLNEIVSQPKITSEFEEQLLVKYPDLFHFDKKKNEYWEYERGTKGFIKDILANRYFLQGEHGKSFLMNNHLSNLQYSPNSKLVGEVESFLTKENKNKFEQIIYNKSKNIGNIESFFALIHGDIAMRNADFKTAENQYHKATNFAGIYRTDWDKNKITFEKGAYDGYNNISSLVFGHNTMESYSSPENVSMMDDYNSDFPFIKNKMNKLELSKAIQQLQKIGKKKNELGVKANQLIGNLLYNTSILGYYRHYFVMDINNQNSVKFHFVNQEKPLYHFYYKNFSYNSSVDSDNFDLAIDHYKKALKRAKDKEQKARILFQMASAEQGKFYQWEATLPNIKWDDNWEKNEKERELLTRKKKNSDYRKYFTTLKSKYSDTETAKDLRKSCSYFNHFMK